MLLCVPNRISSNCLIDPDDTTNDTYEHFSCMGYSGVINALVGKNKWFDLKNYSPDYVIYNRYDRPMPLEYTSKVVSSYSKICLIEYGTSLLKMVDYLFDYHFIANTYCYFAETEAKKNEFIRWNRVLCRLGLSNGICCGIPAVENAILAENSEGKAWQFSHNHFRIIYAPRWTMDPVWGGSSFLKYHQLFISIADSQPTVDILVRPHPLMFDNFINTGLMTIDEVNAYKKSCDERPNIRVDTEKEYLATFWNSSVLICDFSSMIIEYYVTRKPIIYLTYDDKIEYNNLMSAMLKGCYLVNNDSDLKKTIDMLLAGEDPLAPVRSEVCDTVLLQGDNDKASENMKQILLNGYRK